MKLKPVNIIEIILAVLFIAGHILWTAAHIPYMGLITALSGFILCGIYFYGGFAVLRSPGSSIANGIAYGLAFAMAVDGLLFTFQKWPYAIFFISLGLILLAALAVIRLIAVYVFKRPKILEYNKGIAIRYVLLLALLIYSLITLKFS